MSLTKKIIISASVLFVFSLGTFSVYVYYQLYYMRLLPPGQSRVIKVPRGTGIHFLSSQLHTAGMLEYPRIFIWIAKINGDAKLLKAGEYKITANMTVFDLLADIVAGKVMQRSILFVEGWTFRQYKQALADNSHIVHTINGWSDSKIMAKLGHPKQHPEGLFFPDTYFYTWGQSDITILKEAYKRMHTILKKQWRQRAVGLPYKNPYQALIVASLIEKETALASERKLIAGVILRRLEKRMPLQIDPTILYGLGRPYNAEITKDDLALHTLYNTYQRYGLPPTPIDMPGKASIFAALHPDQGDALYYVSKGDGSHQFSSNYRDHRKAVEKYLRKR